VILLSLREKAELSAAEPGTVVVRHPTRGGARLRQLDPGVEQALLCLGSGPVSLQELARTASASAPAADLRRLDHEVAKLAKWGLVQFRCIVQGEEVLVAALRSDLARFDFEVLRGDERLQLSRFAYARRSDEALVLESPSSLARVVVRVPAVAGLLAALTSPHTIPELCAMTPGCGQEVVEECVRVLVGVGAVGVVDAGGRCQEDSNPEWVQREFHDVLLHARSRDGLTDEPLGGLYPFLGVIPPAPAVKPPMSASLVQLPRPDLDRIVEGDPPLAKVMEARRSVRRYGERPISAEELGELLFRVARARVVHPVCAEKLAFYESSDRTYPSGGAAYDLELYVTVRTCRGLRSGMYHYEPVQHALSLVCDRPKLVVGMLNDAYLAAGREAVPQVLITLASRFGRLGWKYRGIAYATTLKNVGVLYEAMYLAATAMGLAACGLGGGNSASFSKATGLDPLVESSVGELMLGTLPGT
jgi:SagB-type dehydrogenase family enzyme